MFKRHVGLTPSQYLDSIR
ncbi:MAG: hypothetical protein NC411_01590 [Bacteroides sp.]|nr:hypothetical protein [Bacteroides sp.]